MIKRHCLPCYLIARNIALMLALIAGALVTAAEVHESAQTPPPEAIALRRLMVYQIMVNAEQP
jgi:hypothetical protein